jgi:hypothetical protein
VPALLCNQFWVQLYCLVIHNNVGSQAYAGNRRHAPVIVPCSNAHQLQQHYTCIFTTEGQLEQSALHCCAPHV